MSAIKSWLVALCTGLLIVFAGLGALVRLLRIALASVIGSGGTVGSRLTARLTSSDGQRLVFTFTRAFVPNLALSTKLIAAYDNSGTVLVTRFEDVKSVLSRDDDFEVVYGPRMVEITGGQNFFLGMQDTPSYSRDVANMRLAMRRDDVLGIVKPFADNLAAELVKTLRGRIDVPQDLSLRVPAGLVGSYFGLPGPTEKDMIAWTTLMFWYLFIDLAADPALDKRTLEAAAQCRGYLDAAIAERKARPTTTDDVLNRCLALQKAGLPGMDDLGIRNNMIGLLIGCVPTISKAAVQALDQLLNRPDALAGAQQAARVDDDVLLGRYVFEALRFNPVNPLIYRRATRDTVIAPHTLRAVAVPRSSMVLAVNLSAMFDRLKLDDPNGFRTDRPSDNYILWGDGLHTCFGAHVNQVLIPAVLKPLLRQRGLRRATGPTGQIDNEGTPFPVHMHLEFEGA
jgi:cytochrome P450